MRTKRVLRYYCDHCSRGYLNRRSATDHEKRCTANPARVCGFCAEANQTQAPLAELFEVVHDIKQLEAKANGCPACMLAAMIDRNRNLPFGHEDREWFEWDYKAAKKKWIADHTDHSSLTLPNGEPAF